MTADYFLKRHKYKVMKGLPRLVLRRLLPAVILLLFACTLGPMHAWPEVPFKHDFEDICSNTSAAESLSVEELNTLIARCDKLRPIIEQSSEPGRTIYLKKLRMCKDLFVYVLESKKAPQAADK